MFFFPTRLISLDTKMDTAVPFKFPNTASQLTKKKMNETKTVVGPLTASVAL